MSRNEKDSIVFECSKKSQIIDHYFELGYVVIEPVVSKAELTEMKAHIDRAMGDASIGSTSSFDTNDFILKVPEIVPIVFKTEYLTILKSILDTDILEIQHSKYNAKSSKGGSTVPLHQDFPYFPHTDDRLLAFNIHFDGSSRNNGGMYCYAGKWGSPLGPHDFNSNDDSLMDESVLADSEIHHFCIPEGGVSIHSSFLPHASNDSVEGKKRRMGVYQLRHPENKQIGGALWKCSNINPEQMEYNEFSYKLNGKLYSGRRLWEPKEYFS